jgi:hypothetical protein
VADLAEQLQHEGADAFIASWNDLLACLDAKSRQLAAAREGRAAAGQRPGKGTPYRAPLASATIERPR